MDDTSTDLSQELDRLSLTQALLDFEVANARVTDLTQRLIEAANEVAALRAELDRRTAELAQAHRRMAGSTAWKIARVIDGVGRRLLR